MFFLPSDVELMSRKEQSGYKWHFPTCPWYFHAHVSVHLCSTLHLQECCWFSQANVLILKRFTSKMYTHDRGNILLFCVPMLIYQCPSNSEFPKLMSKTPSAVLVSIRSWQGTVTDKKHECSRRKREEKTYCYLRRIFVCLHWDDSIGRQIIKMLELRNPLKIDGERSHSWTN